MKGSSENTADPTPSAATPLCVLDTPTSNTPDEVWAALAPQLAGRPRVRLSRGGRGYPRRWERPLTRNLPNDPAAIPIYRPDGTTAMLAIDLDTKSHGRDAVTRDADAILTMIAGCGGQAITDISPNGGRHIYLPLTHPVSFGDARALAADLAAQTPTMDPSPNHNLTDGLIRPPGSAHHMGGHQQLLGRLADAAAIVRFGNPPSVWAKLRNAIPHTPATVPSDIPSATTAARRALTPSYLQIATNGHYDTTRYPSPSEARQAVITAAVSAGMTLPDVLIRIANGTWPGLASFYTRYQPGQRTQAIRRDWIKALQFIKKQPPTSPNRCVRKSPTSRQTSQGGGHYSDEYQFIRMWWSALRLAIKEGRWTGRSAVSIRFTLRAIGEAAMKRGNRHVHFGTRSLAIAAGLDHTTVAAHLRVLRDEIDPFLIRIDANRGLDGDLYELRLPQTYTRRAQRTPWIKGQLHALRPAFRELGRLAAEVYEAFELERCDLTSGDIMAWTGHSRTSTWDALQTLAAWQLVTPTKGGGWRLCQATNLRQLAEAWGQIDEIRMIYQRHQEERAAYRRVLGIGELETLTQSWAEKEMAGLPPPEEETALDVLERAFGRIQILERDVNQTEPEFAHQRSNSARSAATMT